MVCMSARVVVNVCVCVCEIVCVHCGGGVYGVYVRTCSGECVCVCVRLCVCIVVVVCMVCMSARVVVNVCMCV